MLRKIRSDWEFNSFSSFITFLIYRLEHFIFLKFKWSIRFFRFFFTLIKRLFGLQSQISYKAVIGERVRLPHKAFGVVISSKARIGNDVTIFHNVTIGVNESKINNEITIGDRCYLSTGAKVISCNLGEDVSVTPNAVVYFDCGPSCIVTMQGIKEND
ncbi:serine O-acetyltransferase [Vibrio parahaemolyticus]|uniref:serine O-acetyltransferase n=1 Tax=Vibrio parahaemolyticus TaxID=670 RepID=UPI001E2C5E7F|nr:serine acetyltransferase [Vibrio parahaemolyticus]